MPIKLSVAIATYNEEQNIKRCLDSVHEWVDEIVVVDGSSTDDTVKIARSYPKVTLISTTNKPIFHINKQQAIDAAHGDWFLQLDADEVVTLALRTEILGTIQLTNPHDAYWLKRKNLFLGTWLKKSGQYPDPVIRLVKKGKGRLPCQSVHEQIAVSGSVGQLSQPLLHYGNQSFAEYLKRSNRYTSLSAQTLQTESFPLGLRGLLRTKYRMACTFFTRFIRCKGFLDGFPGLVFAIYSALHHLNSFVKYWELTKQQRTIDDHQDWE